MESELLFTFRKLEVGTLKWCKVKMECQARFPHISFRCPLNPLYLRAVPPFKIICNLLSFRSKSKTHIDVKWKIHFLFVLLNSSWSQQSSLLWIVVLFQCFMQIPQKLNGTPDRTILLGQPPVRSDCFVSKD